MYHNDQYKKARIEPYLVISYDCLHVRKAFQQLYAVRSNER